MASVAIRGVKKAFGPHYVIHGVDVEIADGEFVVLVGPSGCGKSTLLRMIAGLENISAGEIRIADRVVNDLPPKERDVAMVFQNYALYPHMTVADNMGFSMRLRGAPASRDRGAGGPRRRHPRSYAIPPALPAPALRRPAPARRHGPRHRARPARCSCSTSRCPISTPSCGCRCAPRSRSCTSGCKTTTIYVTHDQIEAMTMADKIVVMHDGRVEQIGTPLELYDQPGNLFVAGFIGSPAMNFFNGTVRRNGAMEFQCADGRASCRSAPLAPPTARPPSMACGRSISPSPKTAPRPKSRSSSRPARRPSWWRSSAARTSLAVFRERHAFKPGRHDPAQAGPAAGPSVRPDHRRDGWRGNAISSERNRSKPGRRP